MSSPCSLVFGLTCGTTCSWTLGNEMIPAARVTVQGHPGSGLNARHLLPSRSGAWF